MSTETDAAPAGKSVWVAEMYGHALGAAHLGLRYRGFNDTNHHPPGDPIQRACLSCPKLSCPDGAGPGRHPYCDAIHNALFGCVQHACSVSSPEPVIATLVIPICHEAKVTVCADIIAAGASLMLRLPGPAWLLHAP